MIPDNFIQIINLLLTKTQRKEAIWNISSRNNGFKVDLTKGAIVVNKWFDEDHSIYFVEISILNENGDEIDNYSTYQADIENYVLIDNLHNSAKKSYYKFDETIENIIQELNSEKKVGKLNNDDLPF